MVSLKQRLVGAEARQREIANIDPLTGVANRRAFDSALRREVAARVDARAGRRLDDDEPFALLVFDLDDFKAINDDYGHPVGDAVLRRTARRAESVLRSTDLLARIGGDEFAVIAPGSHGDGADRMGDSLAAAISTREPADRRADSARLARRRRLPGGRRVLRGADALRRPAPVPHQERQPQALLLARARWRHAAPDLNATAAVPVVLQTRLILTMLAGLCSSPSSSPSCSAASSRS